MLPASIFLNLFPSPESSDRSGICPLCCIHFVSVRSSIFLYTLYLYSSLPLHFLSCLFCADLFYFNLIYALLSHGVCLVKNTERHNVTLSRMNFSTGLSYLQYQFQLKTKIG